MTGQGVLSALSQEGLWRVTALIRRQAEVAESRIDEVLVPAITDALKTETRLVRLVVDRPPVALDPVVAGMFPPLFDALIEFWFENASDAGAVMAQVGDDESVCAAADSVVDRERSVVWLAQVFPIKPEQGQSRIKFLAGGDAAEGWTVADAQVYWRDVHPVVARTAPSVWEPLTRYVQFHGGPAPSVAMSDVLGTWRQVPMCAEMGFADERDFLTNYSNEEYRTIVRPDEEKFSRPGEALAFISGEESVILARD
jgi:hypothetical protein